MWFDLTSEFNVEKLETRNAIRRQVEEEAPVVITNTMNNDSTKGKQFLQELGRKQQTQGRYDIWNGHNGELETNMPEVVNWRGDTREERRTAWRKAAIAHRQLEGKDRAIIDSCIEEI